MQSFTKEMLSPIFDPFISRLAGLLELDLVRYVFDYGFKFTEAVDTMRADINCYSALPNSLY